MEVSAKILRAKPWLDGNEAAALLGQLCGCSVSVEDFIQLASYHGVTAYVLSDQLRTMCNGGWITDSEPALKVRLDNGNEAEIPNGQMIMVVTPELSAVESMNQYGLVGVPPVIHMASYTGMLEGKNAQDEQVRWQWDFEALAGSFPARARAYFKPASIEMLANIINGTEQPESDADETEQLRKRIAELEAQTKQQAQHIAELEAEAERTTGTGGLMFPYATPELLAMQEAALKHWAGYNAETDKPPQQKAIGIELTEALGLTMDSGGGPSRQAAPLATAIRPEKYRD